MMTEAATTRNYKSTLQLPKTSFNMRAGLAQNEPASLKRWDAANLYEQITAARTEAGAKAFVFHDGPPYANASLHVGHLLNKVLKDFVVRSRLLMGEQCKYVPGWDCHGLPIEHKVMTETFTPGSDKATKINALSDDQRRMAIRRECAKYAEKSIKLQMGQMKRMLTLADYEHPYLTMLPRYEQRVLEVFAVMLERGLVYRALKPVHWSIANQTALAEAELEYEDREDPSVYVDFEAADREAVSKAFGGYDLDQTPSFMIWTTTPWTLPANLAIAVHERFRYALVKVDGNITVIAEDLVEKVTKVGKAQSVDVLAVADGAKLVGLTFRHPFCDDSKLGGPRAIVAADYVTLEDGTGLVHTAPGHGTEDYQTGLRENLPIYCPVQEDGTFDDTAPNWLHGKSVWDGNELVMEHLRTSGHLFAAHRFTHSYPHDWRSKTPVIFRATEQWFIGVDKGFDAAGSAAASLRDRAMSAADHVKFYPEWGRNRMRGMLESRPDWCISRQRAWGLPIPVFFGKEKGQVLHTPASVRAVAQLVGEKGSDIWFQVDAVGLLVHYDAKSDPDAPDWVKNADLASLVKSSDIFDVWFESGSSWNAVLRDRELGYPADLYLEGSDQHRGWFQLSLLPSLAVTGESPFKALLTHGFIVDKDGKKMSKSVGNTLQVDDLLKDYGADVCRWWVSSLAFENDIKMDRTFIDTAGESYRKVRNTLRFLLSNLNDYTPDAAVDLKQLAPASIDAWALAEAAKLEKTVLVAYGRFEFRKAHLALYDFCNETLSAVYCAAVKDRLYCDAPEGARRRTTQTVMWTMTDMLCRLLAPLMPHTADEANMALHGDNASTVLGATKLGLDFSADANWSTVLDVREDALKAMDEAKQRGIENPLDAEVVLPDPKAALAPFAADLPDLLGVSRVKLTADGEISVNDLRGEPRCERSWKRDGTVKQRSDGGMLCDRCAEALGL